MDGESKECCDICDVAFTSPEHASSHYDGRKHKKKVSDATKSSHPNSQLYCKYCKVSVSGPAPMRQHKESAKHIKKVQDAGERTRHESDRSTASSSPSGSTYNDFDIRPDTTTSSTDGNRQDLEERQENHYDGTQFRGTGPSTLMSNPHRDNSMPPSSMNTVMHKQNEALPDNMKVSSSELAARLDLNHLMSMRNGLVTMCKRQIQEQLDQIIPQLAEAIVDKMLIALQDPGVQSSVGGPQLAGAQSSGHSTTTTTSRPPGLENHLLGNGHLEASPYQLFPTNSFHTAPGTLSSGQPSYSGSSSYHSAKSYPPGFNINGTE